MAISKDSPILQSDIASKYTSFNNFIGSYGGSIARLTAPGRYTTIYASQFNALNTKINEFKSDAYLGTQSSWWVNPGTVSSGTVIYASAFNNINTTINNFSKVKCRNNAKNSHGNNSQGKNNHGTCSNGYNGGYNGYGKNPQGSCNGYGDCSRGYNGEYGTCGKGTCSQGDCTSNGTCKNGTHVDITNSYSNA